jgi:hypothetical protein
MTIGVDTTVVPERASIRYDPGDVPSGMVIWAEYRPAASAVVDPKNVPASRPTINRAVWRSENPGSARALLVALEASQNSTDLEGGKSAPLATNLPPGR